MTRTCPSAPDKPVLSQSFFPKKERLFQGITSYIHPPSPETPASISIIDLVDLGQILAQDNQDTRSVRPLLSSEEQKVFDGFTYPKRRTEWLGGRLAAKVSLSGLEPLSFSTDQFATISIMAAENGAPVLICPSLGFSKPALSISHSRQSAVGMTAQAAFCGIDIQQITDRTIGLVDRFAEPAEQDLLRDALPDVDEATRLTLLWSAKEAMKKSLLSDQPVIFQGVRLQSVTTGDPLSLRLEYQGKTSHQADIRTLILGDSILAFTLSGPDHA